jgi:hypothetical protein
MQSAWKTYHNHCDVCQNLLSSHSYLRAMKSLPLETYQKYIAKTKENSSPLELSSILSTIKNFKIHAWAVWKGRKEFRDTYIKNPDENHEYQINLYYSLMEKAILALNILFPKKTSTSSNNKGTVTPSNIYDTLEVENEDIHYEPLPNEEYDWTPCNLKVKEKPKTISDDQYLDLFLKEKNLESLKFYILQFRVQIKIYYSYINCEHYFLQMFLKDVKQEGFFSTLRPNQLGKFWTQTVNASMKESSLSKTTKDKFNKALNKVGDTDKGKIANFATFCEENNLGFHELKEVAEKWELIVVDKRVYSNYVFNKDASLPEQIKSIINFSCDSFLTNMFSEISRIYSDKFMSYFETEENFHNSIFNPQKLDGSMFYDPHGEEKDFVFSKVIKEHFPEHPQIDPIFDRMMIINNDGGFKLTSKAKNLTLKRKLELVMQLWDIEQFRNTVGVCFDLKGFVNLTNQMTF